MWNATQILGWIVSWFAQPAILDMSVVADPLLLVALGIVALSVFELRWCVRNGWHDPEGCVPHRPDRSGVRGCP
jgi:hypothetical protein